MPKSKRVVTKDSTNTEVMEEDMKALDKEAARLRQVEEVFGDGEPFNLERSIQRTRGAFTGAAELLLTGGRELTRIKEHLPHGKFEEVLKTQIDIDPRMARRFMSAATKFSTKKNIAASSINRSKLLELATLDDESLDELDKGGTVAGMTLDDIDRMSTRELRTELRKVKDKVKHDKEVHDKQLQRKDEKLNELDRKLHEKDIQQANWPKAVQPLNIDVTVAAYDVLKGLEKLDVFRDAILNFEPNHNMEHGEMSDVAFDAMAVVYYDACSQVFNHANELMHRCHEVFRGYKNKARPMFNPDDPTPLFDPDNPNSPPPSKDA